MKDSPIDAAGLADDFIAQDDARLFAFINNLRTEVKAKVAAEQRRGRSLPEIVEEVRKMVRHAEEDARVEKSISSTAFPAISRQAITWCMETYRPTVLKKG